MTDVSDLFNGVSAGWVESNTCPEFQERLRSSPQAMKAVFATWDPNDADLVLRSDDEELITDLSELNEPGDLDEADEVDEAVDGAMVVGSDEFDYLLTTSSCAGVDDSEDTDFDGDSPDDPVTGVWLAPASLADVFDMAANPITTLVTVSGSGNPEILALPAAAIEGFWPEANLLLGAMIQTAAHSNPDPECERGWSGEGVADICEDILDTWEDEIRYWPELISSIMVRASRGEPGWSSNGLVDAQTWGLHAAAVLASLMHGWPQVDTWRLLIDALDNLKVDDLYGRTIYAGRNAVQGEE